MITVTLESDTFRAWRAHARHLLAADIAPEHVLWQDSDSSGDLFADASCQPCPEVVTRRLTLSRRAIDWLETASRFLPHSLHEPTQSRWSLLYRIVWRLARGDGAALLAGDRDGSVLHQRIKAVEHEAHHLHAFLRFHRRAIDESGEPEFVAWFEPAHDVLQEAGEHFLARMGQRRWLIATPLGAVRGDGERFDIERPCPAQARQWARAIPEDDEGTRLWRLYYASIFNPARVNPRVTRRQMPQRFWRYLDEGDLIRPLTLRACHGDQQVAQDQAVGRQKGHTIHYRPASAHDAE
ncbi:hypothetical protein BH688_01670 [Kushneria phosphatilytica]|nr:hypothetical protein BH688_01670 [Kushneria phosphatilytica]